MVDFSADRHQSSETPALIRNVCTVRCHMMMPQELGQADAAKKDLEQAQKL